MAGDAAGGNGAGDGKIRRIDELSYSTAPGMTDFEGLKAFDTNNDDVFNAQDTDWGRFRVWVGARSRRAGLCEDKQICGAVFAGDNFCDQLQLLLAVGFVEGSKHRGLYGACAEMKKFKRYGMRLDHQTPKEMMSVR